MSKLDDELRLNDTDLSSFDSDSRSELKRLQRDLKTAINKGDHTQESSLCNAIGSILISQPNLALRYFKRDLEISIKHGQSSDITIAHRRMCDVNLELQKYEEALHHAMRYLEGSRDTKDLVEEQRAHVTIGRTYYQQLVDMVFADESDGERVDDLRKLAANHYTNALKLTDTLRHQRLCLDRDIAEMQAGLYYNIGLLYREIQPDFCKSYLEKVLGKAARGSDIQQMAFMELIDIAIGEADLAQAQKYAEQATRYADNGDDRDKMAECAEKQALVFLHQNKIISARGLAKKALKLRECNNTTTAMTIYKLCKLIHLAEQEETKYKNYLKMATLYMRLGVYTYEPISYLEKELDIKDNSNDVKAEIHEKLAECYEKGENYSMSLVHYYKLYKLSPSASVWRDMATLSMKRGDGFDECCDAIQAGISEASTVQEKRQCLKTMISIAQHFKRDDICQTASLELNQLESDSLPDSNSYSELGQSQELPSDTEISESDDDHGSGGAENQRRDFTRRQIVAKVNEKGETPLHVAAIDGNIKKVQELIKKHASVHVRDNCGWTPLHEACNHGYVEIAQMLIDAGADINDRGGAECEGTTPLHDAAQFGHVNVVRLLLGRGANVFAKNDKAQTAADVTKSVLEEADSDDETECLKEVLGILEEAKKNPVKITPSVKKPCFNDDVFCTDESTSSSASSSRRRTKESSVPIILPDKPPRHRTKVFRRQLPTSQTSKGISETGKRMLKSNPATKTVVMGFTPTSCTPKRKYSTASSTPSSKRKKQSRLRALFDEDDDKAHNTHVHLHDSDDQLPGLQKSTPSDPPPPALTPTPFAVAPRSLRVKVRVRDKLFLIPVPVEQTIADVARIAGERYYEISGLLPKLSLQTEEGAMLNAADICGFVLKDGDQLISTITESSHEPLVQKYIKACERFKIAPVFKDTVSDTAVTLGRRVYVPQEAEVLLSSLLCCTTLTFLDISYFRISKENLSTLTSMLETLSSLKHAVFKCTGLDEYKSHRIIGSLSKLENLEELCLDSNRVSLVTLLEAVISKPSLRIVSASNCRITQNTALSPELSQKFSETLLSSLDLTRNSILHFPLLPASLKTLKLGGSDVFAHGLRLPPNITDITITDASLDEGSITHLDNLRHVTRCNVSFNQLTRDSVTNLLMVLPALEELDVTGNPIGVNGIEELCLVAPPSLSVKAWGCLAHPSATLSPPVTCDLITNLSESLKRVDLSYNDIDYPILSRNLPAEIKARIYCLDSLLILNEM